MVIVHLVGVNDCKAWLGTGLDSNYTSKDSHADEILSSYAFPARGAESSILGHLDPFGEKKQRPPHSPDAPRRLRHAARRRASELG